MKYINLIILLQIIYSETTDICSEVTDITKCLSKDPYCFIVYAGQIYQSAENHDGIILNMYDDLCRTLNFWTTCKFLTLQSQCQLSSCFWDPDSELCYEWDVSPCPTYEVDLCQWNQKCEVYSQELKLPLDQNYTLMNNVDKNQQNGRAVGTWLYEFGTIQSVISKTSNSETYKFSKCVTKNLCELITRFDDCMNSELDCYYDTNDSKCKLISHLAPCKKINSQKRCESSSAPCIWMTNQCYKFSDTEVPCSSLGTNCMMNEKCYLSGSACKPYLSCSDFKKKDDCDSTTQFNCYFDSFYQECRVLIYLISFFSLQQLLLDVRISDKKIVQLLKYASGLEALKINVNSLMLISIAPCLAETLALQTLIVNGMSMFNFANGSMVCFILVRIFRNVLQFILLKLIYIKLYQIKNLSVYFLKIQQDRMTRCTSLTQSTCDSGNDCYFESISNRCSPIQYYTLCQYQGANSCGKSEYSKCVWVDGECLSVYTAQCESLSASTCQYGENCYYSTSCQTLRKCSDNANQVDACWNDPLNCYFDFANSKCRRVTVSTNCTQIFRESACNVGLCAWKNNQCLELEKVSCGSLATNRCDYSSNCYYQTKCNPVQACSINDEDETACNKDSHHCYYDSTAKQCLQIDGNSWCNKIVGASNCNYGSCVIQPAQDGTLQCLEYSESDCGYLKEEQCHFGQCRYNSTTKACKKYPETTATTNPTNTTNTTNSTNTNNTNSTPNTNDSQNTSELQNKVQLLINLMIIMNIL